MFVNWNEVVVVQRTRVHLWTCLYAAVSLRSDRGELSSWTSEDGGRNVYESVCTERVPAKFPQLPVRTAVHHTCSFL